LEEKSGGWRARRKAWMEEEEERGIREGEEEEEEKMERTQATGKLENVKSGWDDNKKKKKVERKTNERENEKGVPPHKHKQHTFLFSFPDFSLI